MNVKRILLLMLIAAGGVCAARADDGDAWWLSEQYKPAGKDVGGVPISAINPDWTAASALTPALLSADAKKYLADPGTQDWTGNVSFERKGDFNKDGIPDRAIVGVYADKSGAMGRFLVVLTQRKSGWAVAFLHQDPSSGPGFSYLLAEGDQLHVGTCFECDGMSDLLWQKHTYVLQGPPDEEEGDGE